MRGDLQSRRDRLDRYACGMDATPTRYRICVHRARGGYYARVVELPGCVGHGITAVESIENVRVALKTFRVVAELHTRDTPVLTLEIGA
jgi:predicted RNase H-like HicB family nuclease